MTEQLGILLLPSALERFELEAHARSLLAIPRVIALEASRHRTPSLLRDAVALRQAKRLRFPGEPRLVVLYHPRQYPLARALCRRYSEAEAWYVRPRADTLTADPGYARDELDELDQLALEHLAEQHILDQGADPGELEETLRIRLLELEIINSRPFVPGARIHGLRGRAP